MTDLRELTSLERRLWREASALRAEVERLKRKCGELCDGQGDHAFVERTIRVCQHCGQSEDAT